MASARNHRNVGFLEVPYRPWRIGDSLPQILPAPPVLEIHAGEDVHSCFIDRQHALGRRLLGALLEQRYRALNSRKACVRADPKRGARPSRATWQGAGIGHSGQDAPLSCLNFLPYSKLSIIYLK